ncbi:nuclease Le1 [Pluteus cervinus]|uniref:Nuclease Le1 n=1 Tax=Pluteus cervinus TaxID=181527 RepID=A0ACD3A3P8_9AGAR|nr:nuclease Le1 [Pluteus cervinus]
MILSSLSLTAFALLSSVQQAYAWGADGHHAVGYVAMEFLSPQVRSIVETALGSKYNRSLGPAASWADEIKSGKGYAWASSLHYIDAHDDPPRQCSVNPEHDCENGRCILTAIANYTSRLVDTDLDSSQRQEALKFLDHFIGDIGQPLHAEGLEKGGNGIKVKCNDGHKKLHGVWDTNILVELLDVKHGGSVSRFTDSLVQQIQTGAFHSSASSWLDCGSKSMEDDITDFLDSNGDQPLTCPLHWAIESNAHVCSTVLNFDKNENVCKGRYYEEAASIIEIQIAKQGYRLAGWLNVLFSGKVGLPESQAVFQVQN